MSKEKARPVVVTTAHRGVFVGYTSDPDDAETVNLSQARMIVYYSAETKGVMGLASHGPAKGSRVSRPVPGNVCLRNITAVLNATPEAEAAWASVGWA